MEANDFEIVLIDVRFYLHHVQKPLFNLQKKEKNRV